MFGSIKDQLTQELADIEAAGLYKRERVITSAQDAEITLDDGSRVLNFCANNYLGLSSHPRVVESAKRAIDTHGFGMSSVRFICGTQDIHKELEQRIADFHHTEDTILYAAAFDANGGGVRTPAYQGRRNRQRQPQPRLHHRRRAPVQGRAVPLRQQRHGRA